MSVIKNRLGKMWVLSGRVQETWLPRTWRRLRRSRTFLPQSSPASAATLLNLQKEEAGMGRMKSHPLSPGGFKNVFKKENVGALHPWVLRELSKDVAKPLPILFEKWQSSDLKRGNITPIYKKGNEKDSGNCRPVSHKKTPLILFSFYMYF